MDQSAFLEPLVEIDDAGEASVKCKLVLFRGEWNGSVDHVSRQFAC